MAPTPFTAAMAAQILADDQSPLRFELYCKDLFAEIDQREYVSTSRNYDLGRDGRAVRGKRVPPFICCGTTKYDPVEKAELDVDRLLQTTQPTELLFCFTHQGFTEHMANKIEKLVRSKVATAEIVRSFGGHQLSQLALQHPAIFERHYLSELTELRSALSVKGGSDADVELTGLRIALTTQLHDDAQARRHDMVQNLILTALASKPAMTATL